MSRSLLNTVKLSTLLALALSAGTASAGETGSLEVVVEGAQAGQGPLYVSVQSRENYMKWTGESGGIYKDIAGGTLVYTYDDLPEGEYAVSIWHDTNNDSSFTMNENFIPQDGWGNSATNPVQGQPSFDDVKILLTARGATATVKMIYPN